MVSALSGVALPRAAKKGEMTPVNEGTVRQGVDTLEHFVKALKQKGADEVLVSTYHYFEKASEPQHRSQYDPDYTLRVFAAFKDRFKSSEGIDCVTLTKKYYPLVVGEDQFHPPKAGHAAYSLCWFEAMLAHDGLALPKWSAEEMEMALKNEQEERKSKEKSGKKSGEGSR